MFKLDLEKAEEPEIKLPTSARSSKKQESSRKTSTSALLIMPKPLTVWITIKWKILKEKGILDHVTCLLKNLYTGQEATARTRHRITDWIQSGKGVQQDCILSTSCKMPNWINHNCNEDFWEKYQQPKIHRLCHSNDRKESEEELKSLLMVMKEKSEKLV